ncbi:PREDICTED: 39S ribosomal protein L39, mitochondrial-like [Rhagoletis zephyria]|uniref:39S ribosomal protein L39, mitochondrial-like n=2 Tax=Rhagoletis zephyria TaxID=28612 RepID=UPI0008112536|nr:PREDICTED: 39S ribosomal protein L39, mitochondrial-like [Rhagoletis zephyria]
MVVTKQFFQTVLNTSNRVHGLTSLRKFSSSNPTISPALLKRNELFTQEQRRQQEAVGRVEKIEVRYLGLPQDVTLAMNANLSTPYNCAQHLSEGHCKRSALALIDGNVPWDVHRPLTESCTLQLLNFTVADPHLINKAFWRTCSFMLGAALENSFTDEAQLQLHSFPTPNIKTGSFVYDVVLRAQSWQPSKAELRALSAEMVKLAAKDLKIERLDVNNELALEMFADSHYKREQLPSIAQQNQGRVTLYRIGTHIDISRGPMVASSRFLGKCTVAAAHKIANEGDKDALYRVQGVALPAGFTLDHVAYGTLEERAKKLNPARLPNEPFEESQQQIA